MQVSSRAPVRQASISAVVTRRNPDGTVRAVEDLGVVSFYHKNPLHRLWWWLTRAVRKAVSAVS
jgi:hypothetical protein